MKRLPVMLRFVAIQLVVLFLVVEVGLRVLHPHSDNLRVLLFLPSVTSPFDQVETLPDLLNQTIIGFNPRQRVAGFLRNSRGFRTHEYAVAKEPGTLRVVLLGDSFSFSCGGIPFSDHWARLLEQHLQEGRTERLELLNLGVPGVGPLFERRLWEIEGTQLDADVLLLQLFVGNDFTDHYDVEESPASALARWSYTVRLARNGTRVLAARREGSLHAEAETGAPAGTAAGGTPRGGIELPEYRERFAQREPFLTPEKLLRVQSQRARLTEASQREAFVELLARMTAVLRELRDQVEAAGVDFRVMIIPDRFQVNPSERAEILALLRLDDRLFDWDKPQRELMAFFAEEGISALDLLPAFREASRDAQLYDVGNTHWNLAGNVFAAREVAAWLGPLLPEPEPGGDVR